jgi:hypothetical protein
MQVMLRQSDQDQRFRYRHHDQGGVPSMDVPMLLRASSAGGRGARTQECSLGMHMIIASVPRRTHRHARRELAAEQ